MDKKGGERGGGVLSHPHFMNMKNSCRNLILPLMQIFKGKKKAFAILIRADQIIAS